MASKLEIKNRIRSVDSTKKITKAMQLVAASKLRKCKDRMSENKEYAFYLKDTVNKIMNHLDGNNIYLNADETKPTLTILYTSDMGLCGGYNANVYRMIVSEFDENDEVIMIGSRGEGWIKSRSYDVLNSYVDLEDEAYSELVTIADEALDQYRKKEISEIRILYTKFVNSVTFHPTIVSLLPVQKEEGQVKNTQETIFEPAGDEILDTMVPMYLRSLLYSYFLETKTSEQASRRMAMESATDNAEELKETLELQFNQARQAAITQEITEIVGGVNALE